MLDENIIASQFNHYPFTWMFHSRKLNNFTNQRYEWALRLVYKNKKATYDELLQKSNSHKVQHGILQLLATEIFKGKII